MIRASKRTAFLVATVMVVVIAALYLWHHHNQKPLAQTTSKQPSAQSNFTSGGAHANSKNSGVTQGGATDNHGDSSDTPGGSGVSSTSGVVTVVSPASNGLLVTGNTVRGSASGVSEVQYRVVDDDVGVVAQGTLSVVNGTFSGTLQFKAHAKTGQLDVFTYNSQYQETNEVRLPVALEP